MTRRSDAGRGALEDIQASRCTPAAAAASPVDELERIRDRVRRLRYDHNNPERFHAERSDIAGAIGKLLEQLRAASETCLRASPAMAAEAVMVARRPPAGSLAFRPVVDVVTAQRRLQQLSKGSHVAR
jgi:hypothetical protein